MVDREVDGPVWVVLTRSLGLCWQALAALGAYLGGLGPLLEPMLAVLGRSWRLCWRSWAVLGRKVALARAGRRSGLADEQRALSMYFSYTRVGLSL